MTGKLQERRLTFTQEDPPQAAGDLSLLRTGRAQVYRSGAVRNVIDAADAGVAGGYAPLNGSGFVAYGYLGTGGTGAGTKFLADDGTWKTGGGGGGTFDHAALTSNLTWSTSAHTGTASRFAVFDSGGAAAYLALPSTGLVSWTGSAWAATTVSAPLGYSGTTLSILTASGAQAGALSSADWTTFNSKEPAITAGTTSQYWRGDKTWQTLDKSAVGLGNVENTALSTWAGSTNLTTLGTVATGTWNGTAIAIGYGGTGATTASDARTNLGLAIGTNVQAYDAGLASLTSADASAGLPYVSAADTWASATYSGMLSVVSGAWKVIGWRESGGQDLTNGAISDGQLVARVGTTVAGVNVSATPTASYVVKADGSGKVDGWVSDATSGTKGKIQLAGDLGGTASSPTVTQARGLRETSGPTTIPIGTIRDGEFLTYAGGVITSAAVNAAVLIFLSEGFDDSDIGGVLDAPPDIIAISDGSDL